MLHPELIRIAARQVRVWRNAFDESKPNLFLLHGGFGDAQWHWHTVWETLAESFNLVAPDLPRFGGTVELPNATFAELLEWLARVQELVGLSQAAFIGNSFGATLARLYASTHAERVTKLFLVNGGQLPRHPKFARRVMSASLLTPMVELLRRQTFSEKRIRRAFANPALVTPKILEDSQTASYGFVALMRQVLISDVPENQTPRAPTLLIWGERDKLAPLARAHEIARELGSHELSNVELAIIKNAGHFPQLEDPLSFVRVVRDF